MATTDEFETLFAQLKQLLQKYEKRCLKQVDTPKRYSLDAPPSEKYPKGLFFGATARQKNYISFYLMPIYVFPKLAKEISPALKKRMQGKSCFNFKSTDKVLFKELAALTQKGFAAYKQAKFFSN